MGTFDINLVMRLKKSEPHERVLKLEFIDQITTAECDGD
jgi:hypothetical protein